MRTLPSGLFRKRRVGRRLPDRKPLPRAFVASALLALSCHGGTGVAGDRGAGDSVPGDSVAARGTARETAGLPGLRGLDQVLIGVNDPAGAMEAYRRLGFVVEAARRPPREDVGSPEVAEQAGSGADARAFVRFDEGFLAFVGSPAESTATPRYTFEGALAQGWDLRGLDRVAEELASRGVTLSPPGRSPDGRREAVPDRQPVAGTIVYFVEGEPAAAGANEPEVQAGAHPNGARSLAYVTVAVSRLEEALATLKAWGLAPEAPVDDIRGSRTVRVSLGRGTLYLSSPVSGGGIADFLEERRAHPPAESDRLYEGSILAVGLGVESLERTLAFFDEHSVRYVRMDLPSGAAAVVQGAPGWALRLEFVESGTSSPADEEQR